MLVPFGDFDVRAYARKHAQTQRYQRKRERLDAWYSKMMPPTFEPVKRVHSDKPCLSPVGEDKPAPALIPRRPDQSIV